MIKRMAIAAASTVVVGMATVLAALLHLESRMENSEEDWL